MTLYSERIIWTPAYPISAVLVAIGAVQLLNDWTLGLVLLGTALLLLWFSTARYTVTNDGLSVGVGGGRPRLRIAPDQIRSVEPSRISFVAGIGYRGSWLLLRRVAVSLGGNGAILITTRTGKRLQLSSRRPNDLLEATAALIR